MRLSVNVNKVATVRNSRGGRVPSVLEAARVVVAAGAGGVTVHPRADERHITARDVRELAAEFAGSWGPSLEYNIEGDPRPDWVDLVCEVRPAQATLVPVSPGEVTSHAGWQPELHREILEPAIGRIKDLGIRVSFFVDAEPASIRWARKMGADRVELYTEPFARAFEQGAEAARRSFETYVEAAELAHAEGLGVNAGHDLDLENLVLFRELPHLDEVSIGHAIVSRAIFVGLATVVDEYLRVIRAG
ncbi:MAG TPA: pyridoxine 5'-phosphate synthase [Polyangiaceae bacterium]|nr:pyridoxine 5'-phosphate synthase [Polyangiaceae bacterium]